MDKSIVPMEESHQRSDSAAKSVGSLVQINSIAIDLSSAVEEIESPAHEHFSIRGFVSGMRKKDMKSCSLFASECHDGNLLDSLPSIHVPKFRWWHCSNCIPEISAERATLEMVLADTSVAGTSSCKNVDGGDDVFSYNRKKTGKKYGSREHGDNNEDSDPSNDIMNSNPHRAEVHKASTCSKDKTDVRTKKGANSCANITGSDTLLVQEIDADSADAYDEPYNAAPGSNAAFSTVPHRRKPKLRSLADIMEEERNLTNDHQIKRSVLSNGTQVTSTGMEAILAPMTQLDIRSYVSKGARSPPRKRKIALEEDKEPLEKKYPNGSTKRSRGLLLDGGRIHNRVETSDSESGGDAATRLSFQIASKTQQINAKKGKALDINKKTRPIVIDNGTVKIQAVPKTYASNSAYSSKAVAAETSMYKLGNVPSAFGEIGPYVRSFLPAQLMETNSDSSYSKSPEVLADHNPFTPPGKSVLGECNIKAKVGLDLSLNSFMDSERNSSNQSSLRQHRGIPDLNESFGQKTDMIQGKQLPNLFEERSLSLYNSLDISTSLNKETATEAKRRMGVSELPTVQSTDKYIELRGTSDDIPIEIIELLAKNKRDRELGNSHKHFPSAGINGSIRGSAALYADGCHRMISFPRTNARTGVVPIVSGNLCVGQSIPLSFPHLNQYKMDMSKLDESQFKLVSPFTQSQQRKPQYLGSSSIIAGPRPREVPDLLWPPRRDKVPFHHIPTNSMGVYSFSDQCHKGKTISDIKGVEGRIGSSPKSVGSLDPYSNDAIPAMQLLSLMDHGIVSGSSVKVSQKHYLDKPFSPCNHHPRLNGNDNNHKHLFSQNNQNTLHHGVYCPGESSRKASSYMQVGQGPSEPKNSKDISLGRPSDLATRPSKNNPASSICLLNRNPADFSIPDSRNEYTISAKDLKRRYLDASKERSRMVNLEGKKKPRVRKNGFGKDNSKK